MLLRAQTEKLVMAPWPELVNTSQPLPLGKSFAVHKRTQSGLTGSEMAIYRHLMGCLFNTAVLYSCLMSVNMHPWESAPLL